MNPFKVTILCAVLTALPSFGQHAAGNSNFWPVHRDVERGFRVSYPSGWIPVPPKGPNVRFSVSPATGAGNCNVVAQKNAELNSMTQSALNREIETLPIDGASWAEYVGLPPNQVTVVEARRAWIHDVPAVLAILETKLENLEGKFTRRQVVALTFTPGLVWSLNCGASTFNADDARRRFLELQPTFNKVFGSFAFLR